MGLEFDLPVKYGFTLDAFLSGNDRHKQTNGEDKREGNSLGDRWTYEADNRADLPITGGRGMLGGMPPTGCCAGHVDHVQPETLRTVSDP